MAFFAIAVVLNAGLIGYPFRFRLGSFIILSLSWTFIIRTGLTLGRIDLHLLQTVVVISLGRNVPLDLSIRLTLEVATFLFYLSFVEALVDF